MSLFVGNAVFSVKAELARIALTSLSSLPLQRSLHRDKAHEHAVAFSDFVESSNGQEALEALQEQVAFLTKLGHESDKKEKSDKIETVVEDARDARDPRAQLESAGLLGVQGDPDKEEIVDEADLLPPDASKLHLPQDQAKDVGHSILLEFSWIFCLARFLNKFFRFSLDSCFSKCVQPCKSLQHRTLQNSEWLPDLEL